MTTALSESELGAGATARLLEISAQYLSHLAATGKIPFRASPYGRVYRVEDVERLRHQRDEAARAREAAG